MRKHRLTGNGGKGSDTRDTDKEKFDDGWDRIWGKKDKKKKKDSEKLSKDKKD